MILSIVIPTYNRNARVLQAVERLLPQLRSGVELHVLDNASLVPVEETLSAIPGFVARGDVHVVRNIANIGGFANMMRSYEVASADWVWILGDDDRFTDTAVTQILDKIAAMPDAVWINFSTSAISAQNGRPQSFDTFGQDGFVEGLDHAGNVNFMSVGLWRKSAVISRLNIAYHYAYTMSPTFTLLLSALKDGDRCHFSRDVLVDEVSGVENKDRWPLRDFVLGWNLILELPMPAHTRKRMAAKMKTWHSPENACVFMLADAAYRGGGGHFFNVVAHRLAPYVGPFARMRFFCYRLFFVAPKLSWRLVKIIIACAVKLRLKGVDLTEIDERARYSSSNRR